MKESVFVYVMYSAKSRLIDTGVTTEPVGALDAYNTSKHKFASAHRPWVMVHYEEYNSNEDASLREEYLKSPAGKLLIKSKLSLI
ncbi:MAG: GIY-YIG nuclease family protein [Bacteroidales bacterium]|nr:GIY-YIG nuclease family protein [Bacteroidales bacterium]